MSIVVQVLTTGLCNMQSVVGNIMRRVKEQRIDF
jgi:hypothetical protein